MRTSPYIGHTSSVSKGFKSLTAGMGWKPWSAVIKPGLPSPRSSGLASLTSHIHPYGRLVVVRTSDINSPTKEVLISTQIIWRRVRSPDRPTFTLFRLAEKEGIATLSWENKTRDAIPLFLGACIPSTYLFQVSISNLCYKNLYSQKSYRPI